MSLSRSVLLLLVSVSTLPTAALAYEREARVAVEPEIEARDGTEEAVPEVVVTAPRRRGEAPVDIPPEFELSEEEIAAYGAGSLAELLEAVAPQVRSGRGRGDGAPVLLINGRRISGWSEVRGVPPEAIERFQVLPEEAALRLGFRADQRVVNVILKQNFRARTTEAQAGRPTAGGRADTGLEASLLVIDRDRRTNFEVQHRRTTALLESERDILPPEFGPDLRRWRTLAPETDSLTLNAVANRTILDDVSATVNAAFETRRSESLFGLPRLTLDTAGRPVQRLLEAPRPLTRDTDLISGRLGLALNGFYGADWRWSFTGGADRARTLVRTDTGVDAGPIQARLDADPGFDPAGPIPAELIRAAPQDRARSLNEGVSAEYVASGPLRALAAGPLSSTVTLRGESRRFDTASIRAGVERRASLSRDRGGAQVSLDLPIARRRLEVRPGLGDLSLNLNLAADALSDFGTLTTVGGGVNWSPWEPLSLIASVTQERGAPTVQQLGDPVVVDPNALVYDFRTGRTVATERVTGGSPDLVSDDRRVLRLGANFRFFRDVAVRNLGLNVSWLSTTIDDPVSAFPTLTPEIEAAFPDRVERAADGRLLRVDTRPVNFARSEREEIRWGLNYSQRLGPEPAGRGPGGGGRGGGAGRGGGGGGFEGFGMGGGRGGGAGRFYASLNHVHRLSDTVLIRPGVPELDFLGGSAAGSQGGRARNDVDAQAGFFLRGLGGRADLSWREGTRVRGDVTGAPGAAGDLVFSDLTTLNLRVFADLGRVPGFADTRPWARGLRVQLVADNVFDARREVRDAFGVTPAGYQRDYLDPVGRSVRLSVRRQF